MTDIQILITVAAVVLGTMLTRFLPFLIFREGKETPKFIKYLGSALPPAVFALLVVYCLKGINLLAYPHGLPEIISVLSVIGIHLLFKQMLVSIGAGTVIYMVLLQFIF
jgi:branched-subunit amino acid transport protein AzlD